MRIPFGCAVALFLAWIVITPGRSLGDPHVSAATLSPTSRSFSPYVPTPKSGAGVAASRAAAPGSQPALPGILTLPAGFSVSLVASGLNGPRFMAFDSAGNLLVGSLNGIVYRLPNANGKLGAPTTLLQGLNLPHSIAFFGGYLYVGESNQISRYPYSSNGNLGAPQVVIGNLPTDGHVSRTVAFGPDGKLYMGMGSSCNICTETDPRRAAISQYNPDGSGYALFSSGMRNPVGLAFQPGAGLLWATVNERDLQGNDIPSDLLTIARQGNHFGWPLCQPPNATPQDPGDDCSGVTPPTVPLQAHSAPLGLAFYTGNQFPSDYQGDIFYAGHGSWNRSPEWPPQIVRVHLVGGQVASKSVFATGWQTDDAGDRWGRPSGVVVAPDGSLIVSDDAAGYLYRFCYNCACSGATLIATPPSSNVATGASVQLTAHATCGETPAFQWWVGASQGSNISWQQAQAYSSTNTFSWNTAGLPSGSYYISVWAENEGGPSATFDSNAALQFTTGPPSPCSNLTETANPPSSHVTAGTSVQLGASAACGAAPVYQWFVGMAQGSGISWQQVQPYSSTSTYTWNTTGLATGTYYVSFWAENQGGPSGSFDASTALSFSVAPQTPCSGLTETSNPASSQVPIGTSVQVTAHATCGGSPVYQWFVGTVQGSNINWQQMQPYSATATFAWNTTGLAAGQYYVSPWVENQGGPSGSFDASTAVMFTVSPAACTGLTETSNPSSSQVVLGSTVQFTAHATCGGTPVYQWFVGKVQGSNVTWQLSAAYAASGSFAWNTSGLSSGSYYVSVWAENQGGPSGNFDTNAALPFSVAPLTACSGATLNSNAPSSHINAGTQVALTAHATCGGTPVYQWWVGTVQGSGINWQLVQAYGPMATYTWNTTGIAPGSYYVSVWAENQGGPPGNFDTNAALAFTVQ